MLAETASTSQTSAGQYEFIQSPAENLGFIAESSVDMVVSGEHIYVSYQSILMIISPGISLVQLAQIMAGTGTYRP